jgi:hypothetical protein
VTDAAEGCHTSDAVAEAFGHRIVHLKVPSSGRYSRVAMPQTKMSAKDLATSFTEKWPPDRSDKYV